MNRTSLLINGEKTQATGGATFERRNPLDGSVATTAPAATAEDALRAVAGKIAEALQRNAAIGPTLLENARHQRPSVHGGKRQLHRSLNHGIYPTD